MATTHTRQKDDILDINYCFIPIFKGFKNCDPYNIVSENTPKIPIIYCKNPHTKFAVKVEEKYEDFNISPGDILIFNKANVKEGIVHFLDRKTNISGLGLLSFRGMAKIYLEPGSSEYAVPYDESVLIAGCVQKISVVF
ncbi:hypothetical protein [Nitratiruptor sp. YY09-18]|uniref:hypothetical protein n=1 Tax=Nitratiruptor sp. YY09-18 TaxID=2724901 RepID=UPI001915A3BE|nr:hypothetical protein [Nitratiruptor sp. YY09-18]BCD67169.1 hypothetical protein NitYY0918_C0039 [Nitratiruptor sp. YY09-18]